MTCDNLLQLSLCIGGTRPQPHSPEVPRNIAFTCSFVCPFLHWTNASGGPDTALCARDSVALMKQTGAVLPRGSRLLRPMEAVIYEPIPGWWVLTWFPFLPPRLFSCTLLGYNSGNGVAMLKGGHTDSTSPAKSVQAHGPRTIGGSRFPHAFPEPGYEHA